MTHIQNPTFIADTTICEGQIEIGPFCSIGGRPQIYKYSGPVTHVVIRSGTEIRSMVSIDAGTKVATYIGHDCLIMHMVHIGHDCRIGDGVIISPGITIGGHVAIGDGTNIGMGVNIHQKSKIPEGCMIGMGSVVTPKIADMMRPNEKWCSKYVGGPAVLLGPNIKKH